MSQKSPFEGVILHTRKYLNAAQLVAHMTEMGYRADDSIVECFVANTVFPTGNFCSFSLQTENPSENMGALTGKSEQTYSERHKSTRGDNLTAPMCIALMEHILKPKGGLIFGGETFYIKTPLFVWILEAYASCLAFDSFLPMTYLEDKFFLVDSESFCDVEDVNKDWLWISATNIQEKCV